MPHFPFGGAAGLLIEILVPNNDDSIAHGGFRRPGAGPAQEANMTDAEDRHAAA
jgi:hypothetical protein